MSSKDQGSRQNKGQDKSSEKGQNKNREKSQDKTASPKSAISPKSPILGTKGGRQLRDHLENNKVSELVPSQLHLMLGYHEDPEKLDQLLKPARILKNELKDLKDQLESTEIAHADKKGALDQERKKNEEARKERNIKITALEEDIKQKQETKSAKEKELQKITSAESVSEYDATDHNAAVVKKEQLSARVKELETEHEKLDKSLKLVIKNPKRVEELKSAITTKDNQINAKAASLKEIENGQNAVAGLKDLIVMRQYLASLFVLTEKDENLVKNQKELDAFKKLALKLLKKGFRIDNIVDRDGKDVPWEKDPKSIQNNKDLHEILKNFPKNLDKLRKDEVEKFKQFHKQINDFISDGNMYRLKGANKTFGEWNTEKNELINDLRQLKKDKDNINKELERLEGGGSIEKMKAFDLVKNNLENERKKLTELEAQIADFETKKTQDKQRKTKSAEQAQNVSALKTEIQELDKEIRALNSQKDKLPEIKGAEEVKSLSESEAAANKISELKAKIAGKEQELASLDRTRLENKLYENLTIDELIQIYESAKQAADKEERDAAKISEKLAARIREFIVALYNDKEADPQVKAKIKELMEKEEKERLAKSPDQTQAVSEATVSEPSVKEMPKVDRVHKIPTISATASDTVQAKATVIERKLSDETAAVSTLTAATAAAKTTEISSATDEEPDMAGKLESNVESALKNARQHAKNLLNACLKPDHNLRLSFDVNKDLGLLNFKSPENDIRNKLEKFYDDINYILTGYFKALSGELRNIDPETSKAEALKVIEENLEALSNEMLEKLEEFDKRIAGEEILESYIDEVRKDLKQIVLSPNALVSTDVSKDLIDKWRKIKNAAMDQREKAMDLKEAILSPSNQITIDALRQQINELKDQLARTEAEAEIRANRDKDRIVSTEEQANLADRLKARIQKLEAGLSLSEVVASTAVGLEKDLNATKAQVQQLQAQLVVANKQLESARRASANREPLLNRLMNVVRPPKAEPETKRKVEGDTAAQKTGTTGGTTAQSTPTIEQRQRALTTALGEPPRTQANSVATREAAVSGAQARDNQRIAIEGLTATNSELNAKVQELERMLADYTKFRKAHPELGTKFNLENFAQELDRAKQQGEGDKKRIQELEAQVRQLDDNLKQMERKHAAEAASLKQATAAAIAAQKSTVQERDAAQRERDAAVQNLDQERRHLADESRDLKARLQREEAEKKRALERVKQVNVDNARLQGHVVERSAEIAGLQQEISSLQQKLVAANQNAATNATELKSVNEALVNQQRKAAQLEGTLAEAQANAAAEAKKNEDRQAALDSTRREAENTAKKAEEAHKEQMRKLQEILHKAEQQIEVLKANLNAADVKNKELELQIEQRVAKGTADALAEVETLRARLETSKKEIEKLKSLIDQQLQKFDALGQELKLANDQNSTLEQENFALRGQLEQAVRQALNADNELRTLREENRHLKELIRERGIKLPSVLQGGKPAGRRNSFSGFPVVKELKRAADTNTSSAPLVPISNPTAHILLPSGLSASIASGNESKVVAGTDGLFFGQRAEKVGLKSQGKKQLDHPDILSPQGMKAYRLKVQEKIDNVNMGNQLLDEVATSTPAPERKAEFEKKYNEWFKKQEQRNKEQGNKAEKISFDTWYKMKIGKKQVYKGLKAVETSAATGAFSILDQNDNAIVHVEPRKDKNELEIQLLGNTPRDIMVFLEATRRACSATGYWGPIQLDNFQPPTSFYIHEFANKMKLNIKFDHASQSKLNEFIPTGAQIAQIKKVGLKDPQISDPGSGKTHP